MKEARLILPTSYASPMIPANEDARALVKDKLLKTFGGFTSYYGKGAWTILNTGQPLFEEVEMVDVAYDPSDESDAKLFDIALQFGQDAKQQEVYLRYGNGHVQMVSEKSCMDNGHGHFDLSFGGMIDAMNDLTNPGKSYEDRMAAFEYLESSLVSRDKAA